jgi:hypothetical protein
VLLKEWPATGVVVKKSVALERRHVVHAPYVINRVSTLQSIYNSPITMVPRLMARDLDMVILAMVNRVARHRSTCIPVKFTNLPLLYLVFMFLE